MFSFPHCIFFHSHQSPEDNGFPGSCIVRWHRMYKHNFRGCNLYRLPFCRIYQCNNHRSRLFPPSNYRLSHLLFLHCSLRSVSDNTRCFPASASRLPYNHSRLSSILFRLQSSSISLHRCHLPVPASSGLRSVPSKPAPLFLTDPIHHWHPHSCFRSRCLSPWLRFHSCNTRCFPAVTSRLPSLHYPDSDSTNCFQASASRLPSSRLHQNNTSFR